MDNKEYIMLKYIKKHPELSNEDISNKFGKLAYIHFNTLKRNGYIKQSFVEHNHIMKPQNKFSISDLGEKALLDRKNLFLANILKLIAKEMLTIITAILTTILTTIILHYLSKNGMLPY